MSKKQLISFLSDSVLAGLMIGVGGVVSLSSDNRYIGAVLFSLGLLTIIHFKFGLYTGKVGNIARNGVKFIPEVAVTLLGNGIGTFLAAVLIRLTRIAPPLVEKAQATVQTKTSDSIVSMFILGIFCGMLMFIAVDGYRKCKENSDSTAGFMIVAFPVIVFIISGFNHCIADMFYIFLAGEYTLSALGYFVTGVLGNAVGGMLIPTFKKVSENKL